MWATKKDFGVAREKRIQSTVKKKNPNEIALSDSPPTVAMYAWETAVLKAVLEPDNALIYCRITAARSILIDRLITSPPIGNEERSEIENALQRLDTLELERCG